MIWGGGGAVDDQGAWIPITKILPRTKLPTSYFNVYFALDTGNLVN